jgi:hypothetical protein
LEAAIVAHEEVLDYARRVKKARPRISRKEMHALLQANFLHGKDALAEGRMGAVNNPMDWLKGLGLIVWALTRDRRCPGDAWAALPSTRMSCRHGRRFGMLVQFPS